jgi:dTDP-4-amino-4,6-dideoxygalactose transaminase
MNWIANKNIDINLVNSLLEEPLKTNQFTNGGANVKKLENYIKKEFKIDDTKAVITVTNGSVALHALSAGIEYTNNRIINWATQAFTFPPSAQSNLRNIKILDIDKDGGLDLKKVDDTIDGLIVTNIFGNIVDIEKYETFSKKYNKFLIFDNAATGYTEYNRKNCLNYGDGCTISFHHTKPFGFGEGGVIIVNKKYENSIRCLNNFGINLTEKYWVPEGNNNKMSEISAIYILQYLERNIDKIIKIHNEFYLYFKEQMIDKNIKHFKLFPSFHDGIIVPSCFCILFNNFDDSIIEKLIENNIQARKYYHPLDNSKVANEIYDSILCIPCNIDMDKSYIDKIFFLLEVS